MVNDLEAESAVAAGVFECMMVVVDGMECRKARRGGRYRLAVSHGGGPWRSRFLSLRLVTLKVESTELTVVGREGAERPEVR